jgi:hypothetical protein
MIANKVSSYLFEQSMASWNYLYNQIILLLIYIIKLAFDLY